jgi:PhnB protein
MKPMPEGFHTITPYLVVEGAEPFLDFVERAFAAIVTERIKLPEGGIRHAEARIGDSMLMIGEAKEGWPAMPSLLHLYVEDVDAAYQRALQAGATSITPPADQLYGDRAAGVKDNWGNSWWLATHVEDVAPEEVNRRAAESTEQTGASA